MLICELLVNNKKENKMTEQLITQVPEDLQAHSSPNLRVVPNVIDSVPEHLQVRTGDNPWSADTPSSMPTREKVIVSRPGDPGHEERVNRWQQNVKKQQALTDHLLGRGQQG